MFIVLGLILAAGINLKRPRQRVGTPPARKQSVGFAAFRTDSAGRFAKTPVRIALTKDWRFLQRSDNPSGGTICDAQGTPLCEAHVNITPLPKGPDQDPLAAFVAAVSRQARSASRRTISNAGYQTVDGHRLWLQRTMIKEPMDPFFSLPKPAPADNAFRRRGPSGSLVVAEQRDDMIVEWIFLAHLDVLDSVVTQALPWVRQAVIGTR